jgi:hypothetical protein
MNGIVAKIDAGKLVSSSSIGKGVVKGENMPN